VIRYVHYHQWMQFERQPAAWRHFFFTPLHLSLSLYIYLSLFSSVDFPSILWCT
jgi:hypothetical protein